MEDSVYVRCGEERRVGIPATTTDAPGWPEEGSSPLQGTEEEAGGVWRKVAWATSHKGLSAMVSSSDFLINVVQATKTPYIVSSEGRAEDVRFSG